MPAILDREIPNFVPGADGPVFFRRPPTAWTRVRGAVGRFRLQVLPRVGVRKVHPVLRERHDARVGEHRPEVDSVSQNFCDLDLILF